MAKFIKCCIDLNQYEAIKEGEPVAFEEGWNFEAPLVFVRPAFEGPSIGTAVTTEKIWDRHRPVSWFMPWRLLTQPFRPAMRKIWISCPDDGSKIKVTVSGIEHLVKCEGNTITLTEELLMQSGGYGL